MDINKLRDKLMYFVEQRCADKGFELTPELSYMHLTEEVGEIARQFCNKEMRPDLYNPDNLREEIVDVILEGIVLASSAGIKDVGKALGEKLDKLYERHGYQKPE